MFTVIRDVVRRRLFNYLFLDWIKWRFHSIEKFLSMLKMCDLILTHAMKLSIINIDETIIVITRGPRCLYWVLRHWHGILDVDLFITEIYSS